MHEIFSPYTQSIGALGVLGLLMLIQSLVVDFSNLRRQHPPGMPVTSGPDDFLFRAYRAQGNSNENLPTLLLIFAFALIVGANPSWVNGLMVTFVAARAGHMFCYYFDLRIARSVAFGVGLLATIMLLIAGFVATL